MQQNDKKPKMRVPYFQVGNSIFWVGADRYCWHVARKVKSGFKDVTYHGTRAQVYSELMERLVKEGCPSSLEDLVKLEKETREWLRKELNLE